MKGQPELRPQEPKWTIPYWYVTITFVCSLLFVVFQGGKLATLLFVTVTVLCLYLVLGRWSGIRSASGVRSFPEHEQEARLRAGQSLAVQVRVQVPGLWPIPYMLIRDRITRHDGDSQAYEGTLTLDWKRRGEIEYVTAPLKRGIYRFGHTDCVTEDVFGLFQHKGTLDLSRIVTVTPETVAIPEWNQYHLMIKGMQMHATTTRALRETTQINGVREYIYGDKLSRVHWNATAKTGTWKSKEFERESLPKTIIVLDRHADAYSHPDQFELAVSIAASLFEYAAAKKLAIGLLSVGSDYVMIEPKLGVQHLHQVMNHLTSVDADGEHSIGQVLQNRSQHWTPGTFFVLVTPGKGTPMMKTLGWLEQRQMNPCHMWISSDPVVPAAGSKAAKTSGRSAAAAEPQGDWIKQLQARGYLGYAVTRLHDLPAVLGGGKQSG
ncbi:DUF58 domain-containing protein [Paenibacillus chartarius]|uniref:DUF58 domain-containing protein n=1 Tax=Paenibacillus chartarius TaxID=747481 RepID=A0ABV6DT84_9BACL